MSRVVRSDGEAGHEAPGVGCVIGDGGTMTVCDADGDGWPPGSRAVYLDQFVYVRLAKAGLGRGSTGDAATRSNLLRPELPARTTFPLSLVHYLETWRCGNDRQRRELADEMMTFSRLNTLAPAHVLWRHEIERALHETFGRPATIAPIPAEGRGVLHAFGHDPTLFANKGAFGNPSFELSLLAADGIDAGTFAEHEAARHAAEQQFADHQTAAATKLATWKTDSTDRRQRFRIQALTDFQADIIPALMSAGIDPEELAALGPNGLEGLVAAIPTIWALTELRRVHFGNPTQRFTKNDLNDLRALASAVVYCDVVVTDKAWCSAVRRTDLCERFGTVVLSDVAKVEGALRQVEERDSG